MSARDPYRFLSELEETTIQSLVNRLESRGKDPTFARLLDEYLDKLPSVSSVQVLDLGCGTGVAARALARRKGFSGQITGVDHGPVFIEAARRLAAEEGVGDKVKFRVGDAHALDYSDGSFDAVILHTLISHVTEALTVLKEAARVVRPGGTVAIFDGDYSSLTYAYPDPELGELMDGGLVAAVFNNPRVMPSLPRWLRQVGLELAETLPHVYAEIGTGGYFKSFAETYAPLVSRAGLVSKEKVDIWLAEQRLSPALTPSTFLISRGITIWFLLDSLTSCITNLPALLLLER